MENSTAKNGFHASETQQHGATTSYEHSKIGTTPKMSSLSSAYNREVIVIFRALAIVIALVGALFNGIVLRVLFARRSKSQKFTLLFVNQIVLDFFSCVALLVTYVAKIPGIEYRDDGWSLLFCIFFHVDLLVYYFQQGSVCNLVLIAIERNVLIVHQVTYKRYFRKWMVYAGVVLSWVLPIPYDLQVFFTSKVVAGQCEPGYAWPSVTSSTIYGVFAFLSIMVVPLLTLTVCYGGILYFVRRHKRVMHANQTRQRVTAAAAAAAGSNSVHQKSRRQEMELVVTMLLISTMYFVSWTPNQIWLVAQMVNSQMENSQVLYTVSIIFVYLSACFNPFIYVSKQESIRRGVMDILRRVRSKSGVQGTMSKTETIQTISFTA